MGFSTIWLSPIFDSRQEPFGEWGAYHGYWVDSMESVEPRFGSESTLKDLSDEIHTRNMRLVVDVVYNHTSFDSPLTTEHPDWYHPARPIENWHDPFEAQTHQVHGLPDLDQSNPEVQDYLLDSTTRWIQSAHIDGLRIDAVRHIDPKFFPLLQSTLTETFGTVSTIGEIFDGNRRSVVDAWRQSGFQSVFDFPLYYAMIDSGCRNQHAGRIAANLAYDQWTDIPGEWVTFLDNHDLPRLASVCGSDRVPLMLALQMSSRGRPMMTYGTESGLEGSEEPANRADMNFDDTPHVNTVREMLELRRSLPALTNGDTHIVALNSDGYAALRTVKNGHSALVVVNLGTEPIELHLPEWIPSSDWTIRYGNATIQENGIQAEPNSVSILEHTDIQSNIPSSKLQRVHFNSPLPTNGTIKVVGEGDPLGNWDPHVAPIIPPDGLTLEIPTHAVLEYKLVHKEEDGTVIWENRDNRYFLVSPSSHTHSIDVAFTTSETPE